MSISWAQALAWRLRRQLLDPVGTESVAGVVRRLGAVPAQPDASAELAIRTRRQRSRSGEVARALAFLGERICGGKNRTADCSRGSGS